MRDDDFCPLDKKTSGCRHLQEKHKKKQDETTIKDMYRLYWNDVPCFNLQFGMILSSPHLPTSINGDHHILTHKSHIIPSPENSLEP